MDFSIEQSFTDLEPGTYELSAFSQGGDLAADASMELYAVVDGKELTVPLCSPPMPTGKYHVSGIKPRIILKQG